MGQPIRSIQRILSKWFNLNHFSKGYYTTSDYQGCVLVHIHKGPYKGTEFVFDNIRVGEINPDGSANIDFDRRITNEAWKGHDYSNDEYFTKIAGGIFESILASAIRNFSKIREEI